MLVGGFVCLIVGGIKVFRIVIFVNVFVNDIKKMIKLDLVVVVEKFYYLKEVIL